MRHGLAACHPGWHSVVAFICSFLPYLFPPFTFFTSTFFSFSFHLPPSQAYPISLGADSCYRRSFPWSKQLVNKNNKETVNLTWSSIRQVGIFFPYDAYLLWRLIFENMHSLSPLGSNSCSLLAGVFAYLGWRVTRGGGIRAQH